ncbi:MAG: HlyD family efflux transporter periplasmic adaptor subunit [Chitinophagales bacterium]|nr:HlyD family efflux transporter periplasmic adaptor subunit [Chitinophagales bacterium]
MPNVIVRRWSLIAALIIIFLAFFINNRLQSMKKPPEQKKVFDSTPVVNAMTVSSENLRLDIPLTGRLVSKNKIEVFSEVTGKLLQGRKAFKEGVRFSRGEALLKIDDSDFKLSLIANRSNFHSQITLLLADMKMDYPQNFDNWKSYTENFNPELSLQELPEVKSTQERGLLVARNIYNQFYTIQSQEAQLGKYMVIAPFTGVVSSANVSAGSLIRAGQKVGEFLDPYLFELEVGLSVPDVEKIKVGSEVQLTSNDVDGKWQGKVTRISKSVDDRTQTLKAYIEINSKDLFEGIYLNADIGGNTVSKASKIPSNIVFDKNKVYLIEDGALRQQELAIVHRVNNNLIVQGIPDGAMVMNQVLTGARDGMKVKIAE